MCGAVESDASVFQKLPEKTDLVRIVTSSEKDLPLREDNPGELKVYVLRRFMEEGDMDWMKGIDVVVAHTLKEALDIAEATHPGSKKLGKYKSYNIVFIDEPHFAYGRAFEGHTIHY